MLADRGFQVVMLSLSLSLSEGFRQCCGQFQFQKNSKSENNLKTLSLFSDYHRYDSVFWLSIFCLFIASFSCRMQSNTISITCMHGKVCPVHRKIQCCALALGKSESASIHEGACRSLCSMFQLDLWSHSLLHSFPKASFTTLSV